MEATGALGTNTSVFIPDSDPSTTTDPLDSDSDDDGLPDAVEDVNANGRLDALETDASMVDSDSDGLQAR